jgi:hypothetical protein
MFEVNDVKFPVLFVASEDGKMRPKYVRLYNYLIIKETDKLDNTFILFLIYYNIEVVIRLCKYLLILYRR